jgi:pimeloyl-ACP methyl ester carboxylesterase
MSVTTGLISGIQAVFPKSLCRVDPSSLEDYLAEAPKLMAAVGIDSHIDTIQPVPIGEDLGERHDPGKVDISSLREGELHAPFTAESRFEEVDGTKIHYLTAGDGPAVFLLHGYTQTSRMWRPLIPKLMDKFTVVAPDLPGIGDSDIPKDGLDMKTAAIRIHALAKALKIRQARVVGHDIGLMVAYAYAAQFPSEVQKLAVMDAFLPGVPGWELAYDSPNFWHFRFHGPTPEALVQGREKTYFAYFWNDLAADGKRSLSEPDRVAYVAAYSRPGRMRAGWAYFASWPDTAKDFAQMAQRQLTMPVLSIAGEKASAAILGPQMKRVATDVKVVELKGGGHWLMEERSKETMDTLVEFL